MADIKLVGAVAIKVRPDARGFRGATQKAVAKELAGVDGKVKIKVTADTAELAKEVEKAKEKAEKTSVTLRVGVDYDSLRAAQKQLEAAVKRMDLEKLVVELDQKGIEDAREFLDAMIRDSKVTMTMTPDEKGFKQVLDRIAQIRREKLEKEIEFAIDDQSLDDLEREMQDKLAKIVPPQRLRVAFNPDRSSLQAAIDKVNNALAEIESVKIDVDLDAESLRSARKDLEAVLAKTPVELKINYDDQDSLKAARSRLKELLSTVSAQTLSVDFNEEAIKQELQRIDGMIDDVVEEKRKVELPVHTTGLGLVARQLQFASRPRRVPFHVVVDQKSLAIAEGILRSLAGVNTLQSAGRGLETLITKFDTIALKAGSWGAAIGGLTDTLFYMTSSIFTVGGGLAQMVGLAALAPTAFAALASTLIIGIAVFKDFGAAAHGIDAALKRLPPAGKKAALEVRKVFADMRESISQRFWSTASEPMLRFVRTALPAFTRGLTDTSEKLGVIFGGILDSFSNMGASGGLDAMFKNLVKGFDNSAAGATALWDAFNILGLRGSEFLPRFGTWLADISIQFRDWLKTASDNGDLFAWIHGGVQALKDAWYATGALIDQFKAITRAANLIGPNGLDDFRRNMEHIARVMLAEPFQSRMGTIFAGARTGASELNIGIKNLGRTLGESATFTGELLTLLGRLGGLSLSGFARTIGNLKFQTGLLDSLRGMNDMVRTMEPAFDRLGSVIGRVASISSSVFRGLGPVFNTVLSILDEATARVGDNLGKIAPDLLNLTNNLLNFARGPILLVVDILNGFLGALNALPGPMKDAAVAFVTFLLLRNQFGAFATSLNHMWTNITTSSVKASTAVGASAVAATAVTTAAAKAKAGLVIMADGSVRQMTRFGAAVQNGMTSARTQLNSFRADVIPRRLQGIVAPVVATVGRINTALSLIGGIPGLILGGIGVAVAAIGGNAADASANIDALHMSLDKTTGGNTVETLEIIAKKISDVDEAGDAWANFWRGVVQNSKAGNETLEQLGLNVGQVAQIVTGSRGQYDSFIGQLKTLSSMDLGKVADFMNGINPSDLSAKPMAPGDEFSTNTSQLKALTAAANAAKELGIAPERLRDLGGSLSKLTGDIEEQRKAWEASQIAQKIYADTLGTTTARAQEIAQVSAVLRDTSRDAAGQIDAIRRSLELLNNTGASEQEARIARQDNLSRAVENAKNIAAAVKESRKMIFDENGLISEQSKAGRDLFGILREGADSVLIHAKGAYNTARQNGETAAAAAEKARAIVKAGETDLAKIAEAAGLTVGDLKAQWDTFFGADWTLTATFTGTTEQFQAAIAEAEAIGVTFDAKKFTAWLLANPDPAKVSVDQVKAYMQDYAVQTFKATLDALPAPAQAAIASVLGKARAFANGDYTALLEAWNQANPIVQGAINFIRNNYANAKWMAIISAAADSGSLVAVEQALINLSRPRTAVVNVTYADVGRDVAMANRMRGGGSRMGSIMDRFGRGMNGFNPEYFKFFANGGIEKHVAQIASARGPVRVWAEPETHGEAYIPLALSKRPRSVSILGEVAKKFGYELNSRRDQHYSSGAAGGTAVPQRTSSTSVTVGTINTVDPEAAVKKLRTLQQDALALEGII